MTNRSLWLRLNTVMWLLSAARVPCLHAQSRQSDSVTVRVVDTHGLTISAAQAEVHQDRQIIPLARSVSDGALHGAVFRGPPAFLIVRAVGFTPDSSVLSTDPGHRRRIVVLNRYAVKDTIRVVRTRRRAEADDADQSPLRGYRPPQSTAERLMSTQLGNTSGLIAMMPNVEAATNAHGEDGLRIGHLPQEQSLVTLNGFVLTGVQLPAAAVSNVQLFTSPFDPSRGGFSGGELALSQFPGGGNARRSLRLAATPSAGRSSIRSESTVQTSAVSDASVSLSAAGRVGASNLRYSVTGQGDVHAYPRRAATDLANFAPDLGIAREAAKALQGVLLDHGIPLTASDGARRSSSESGSSLLRLDYERSQSLQFALTTLASGSRSTGNRQFEDLVSTTGSSMSRRALTFQLQSSWRVLDGAMSESGVALTRTTASVTPDLVLPRGRVMLPLREDADQAPAAVMDFGGGVASASSHRDALQLNSVLSRYSENGAHRYKVGISARHEISARAASSSPGAFEYASISDLARNQPALFERSIAQKTDARSSTSASLFGGDLWEAGPRIRLQYGVRIDASRAPSTQTDFVTRSIGQERVDFSSVDVSPRLGFEWALTSARPEGERWSAGALRGGVGRFQSTTAQFQDGTDEGGALTITCTGTNVPRPDWRTYSQQPASIPAACMNGDGADQRGSPRASATALSNSFGQPYAWRSALGWSGTVAGMYADVDLTYSINRNQPSLLDANFTGEPRFLLERELKRPVYVSGPSISADGVLSDVGSRMNLAYDHLYTVMSDARSWVREADVGLGKTGDEFGSPAWSIRYAYINSVEQTRGFDGVTFGDPRALRTSPGAAPRHSLSLYATSALTRHISLFAQVQARSGRRYSPTISSDINGDGLANDIAVLGTNDREVDGADRGALRCVLRDERTVTVRNMCTGPVTALVNAGFASSPGTSLLPARWKVRLTFENVLGLVDQAVGGSASRRGWGAVGVVDAKLLVRTGFDQTTQAYKYALNPRFGQRLLDSRGLAPGAVHLEVSVNLGPSAARPALARIGRDLRLNGRAYSGRSIRQELGLPVLETVPALLEIAESLGLSAAQAAALRDVGTNERAVLAEIWRAVDGTIQRIGAKATESAQTERLIKAALESSIDTAISTAERIGEILSIDQRRLIQDPLKLWLDPRSLKFMKQMVRSAY